MVRMLRLFQDKDTGFHRGFCWVGFTTEEGLNNALQKDPHMLEGAKVELEDRRMKTAITHISTVV